MIFTPDKKCLGTYVWWGIKIFNNKINLREFLTRNYSRPIRDLKLNKR